MPPNAYIATLAASLASNGTESEIYVSTITTLTGENVATSQFTTLGRGVMTIDPLSSTSIEFASFTTVDASGIGFTGITRGLSSLSNSTLSANKKYHPVGTQVIISFGVHNLLDLQTYVTGLVSGSLGTATDATAGSTKIGFNMGSIPRARHSVVSQSSATGTTALSVNPFSVEYSGATYGNVPSGTTAQAASNTSAIVAPLVNPRIDLVVWTTSSSPGSVAVRTGTEAVSPSAPTPTEGDIILCAVYNRVSQTKILDRDDGANGFIQTWFEPSVYSSSTAVTTKTLSFGADQSQTTQNSSVAVGEANATTKKSILAQSFVPTTTAISGFKFYKSADTGSFTGTVKISLQADSSGNPSAVDLGSYTISNAAWLKLATGEFSVLFSTEYGAASPGSLYWLVVTPSTSDTSNHPNLGINTAGGYAAGTLKFNNSTDGWTTIATSKLYFKEMSGVVSRVAETDSTGLLPIQLRPYALIALDNASATVNSTVAETVLFSKNLEGGLVGTTGGFRFRAYFRTANLGSGALTATFRLKLNSTAIATVGSIALTAANGPQGCEQEVEAIVVNNASASAQITYVRNTLMGTDFSGTITAQTQGGVNQFTASTAAVDTSQPMLLEVTAQLSATSGTSMSAQYKTLLIERIG